MVAQATQMQLAGCLVLAPSPSLVSCFPPLLGLWIQVKPTGKAGGFCCHVPCECSDPEHPSGYKGLAQADFHLTVFSGP